MEYRKVGDLFLNNGVYHVVITEDGYGGYVSITLKEYILRNTAVTLKDGLSWTLNELAHQQIDKFLSNYNK